ncbi:hypothetical protein [Streptomyces flaveus]|uniref:hypothetical protein n=1 Tax=Streptomyces flaveus TaxID=66370 RepID=UPI003328AAD9
MDGETIVAVIAAGISAAAAIIAAMQAKSARAQVVLLQRQIIREEQAWHEEIGPTFEVLSGVLDSGRVLVVEVKQTGGPALSELFITATGEHAAQIPIRITHREALERQLAAPGAERRTSFYVPNGRDFAPLAPGGTIKVEMLLESESTPPVTAHLRMACRARDTGATWVRDLSCVSE